MLKKIHILLALAFAFPAVSQAFNGGPFDNADNSITLDNTGIYQCAMRFKNGSGFAQWGVNVQLAPAVSTGTGNATNTVNALGGPLNRSVLYYKGVTYVGMASGMVDQERGQLSGFTNSYSNFSTSNTANAGGVGQQSVTASSVVVSNPGVNFTANSQFEGHIYQKSPILKFHGSGELTVLNPSLTDSLFAALQTLVASYGTATSASQIDAITFAIQSIINNNLGTPPFSGNDLPVSSSAESVYQNSDTTHMKVFGSRIFFLTIR